MSERATITDADLILKLYDLRREAEMRKARNWWLVNFWPESPDDFMKIGSAMGTQENNWLRQVAGYWSMAASLALAGTVNQDLFLDPSFSGEMFFLFAKVKPFLGDLRTKMKNPRILTSNRSSCVSFRRFLRTGAPQNQRSFISTGTKFRSFGILIRVRWCATFATLARCAASLRPTELRQSN